VVGAYRPYNPLKLQKVDFLRVLNTKDMKKVSILGCGWLGKALAKHLESQYTLYCSVNSQSSFDSLHVKNKFLLNSNNKFYNKTFYECDVCIIAIPPRGDYLQTLETILSYLKSHTQVILCSSTSVYTQISGEVYEEDTNNLKNPPLMLQAENRVKALREDTLLLRLAGLMGYDRVAGKYSADKTLEYDSYVNYVHRDDVVAVISLCIKQRITSNCYNVVAPVHSSKKEVYDVNAKQFGFGETFFTCKDINGKKVMSSKLVNELDYIFLKKEPLLFWT